MSMFTRHVDYLSMLTRHVYLVKTGLKHEQLCTVCGENKCYAECGLCNIPLLYVSNRGSCAGKQCFVQWHDESYFELSTGDSSSLIEKRKANWEYPTSSKLHANQKHISLMSKWNKNLRCSEQD